MASKHAWTFLLAASIGLASLETLSVPAKGQDWRSAGDPPAAGPSSSATPAKADRPDAAKPRIAKVSAGKGALPNEQGQLWREYDITPYTLRVASTNRPEQAIVDWVLRETGYEVWHGEPLAILSADRRTLYVYHTPAMQEIVAGIVDRFVSNEADSNSFSLRVATVNSPNWRIRARQMLQPLEVQTPGVQAWLLEREAAATLVADLRRRTDFRELSSPQRMVNNGQSSVISATRGTNYVRDARLTGNAWPGYQSETAVIDEGFSLEFTPLVSVDRSSIDAVLKCQIDQVEKMVPVMLDVPTPVAPRQRAKIEVPQLAQFQFHERFQWPANKVLLVGLGMVPHPSPSEGRPIGLGLPLGLSPEGNRADLLVFIETKADLSETAAAATAARPGETYRGRY